LPHTGLAKYLAAITGLRRAFCAALLRRQIRHGISELEILMRLSRASQPGIALKLRLVFGHAAEGYAIAIEASAGFRRHAFTADYADSELPRLAISSSRYFR
jgi:hypothetical protein